MLSSLLPMCIYFVHFYSHLLLQCNVAANWQCTSFFWRNKYATWNAALMRMMILPTMQITGSQKNRNDDESLIFSTTSLEKAQPSQQSTTGYHWTAPQMLSACLQEIVAEIWKPLLWLHKSVRYLDTLSGPDGECIEHWGNGATEGHLSNSDLHVQQYADRGEYGNANTSTPDGNWMEQVKYFWSLELSGLAEMIVMYRLQREGGGWYTDVMQLKSTFNPLSCLSPFTHNPHCFYCCSLAHNSCSYPDLNHSQWMHY